MPGADADFAAYLAARWPALVRTLVFLGCGRPEADEVARIAMARCHHDWERVRRDDDLDAYVYGLVVASLHRHRRRVPERPVEPLPDDATDDEILCRQLLEELERLDADERETVVLRFVAELSEAQVADAVDIPLESAQARITHGLGRLLIDAPLVESFRRASESIPVPTTPVDEVVAEARAQVRHRWRVVAAAVAVAAVVLAGLTWIGTRPPAEPDGTGPATVTHAANPVDVGWYAAGRLHLDHVTVEIPDLTDFGEIDGGAVYGDRSGHVAFVDAQGDRREIGTKSSYLPLVVSVGTGWAAWIEPVDDTGRIVVWDAVKGRVLAELPVGPRTRLIAIDQDQVFYAAADGDYGWTPPNGEPVLLERPGLVEVESATRVYQEGRTIDMVQPFFSVDFKRPGIDPIISPGGSYAVAASPASNGTPPFRPLLYDVRSGTSLPTGFAADDFAVDVTFGDNHSVVYLVVYAGAIVAPHPLVVLRTCELGAPRCTDVVPLATDQGMPLLGN